MTTRSLICDPGLSSIDNLVNSHSIGPNLIIFHVESPGAERTKTFTKGRGHIKKMATMLIYCKLALSLRIRQMVKSDLSQKLLVLPLFGHPP